MSATAVGQETEVADAHEAWGEHVEEKAPQELVHRQGHQALLIGVGGVSPAKGDLVAGERDEAVVGQNRPSTADC